MQDQLKRLNELTPSDEAFEEELLKIRGEIIEHIRHIVRILQAAQVAEKAYEGEKDFVSFILEDTFPETKMPNIKFEKLLSDPKVREALSLMASVEYIPSAQFRDVLVHLTELYAYYVKLYEEKQPFSLAELVLIYSFSKLMYMAGNFFDYYLHKGPDSKRTKDSARTRKKKADERKSIVIAIYEHGKFIAPGSRRSLAIKMIQRQFKESKKSELNKSGRPKPYWGAIPDDMKIPGRDTIIGMLKVEGILERDFEDKDCYWFKKM